MSGCLNAYSSTRSGWHPCTLPRFHDGPCSYEGDGLSMRERLMWELEQRPVSKEVFEEEHPLLKDRPATSKTARREDG